MKYRRFQFSETTRPDLLTKLALSRPLPTPGPRRSLCHPGNSSLLLGGGQLCGFPTQVAAIEVVDILESELLERGQRTAGPAAGPSVDDVGFVLIEFGKLRFKILGAEVDVLSPFEVPFLELTGGADVENDGLFLFILRGAEFGGGLGVDVSDGTLFRRWFFGEERHGNRHRGGETQNSE